MCLLPTQRGASTIVQFIATEADGLSAEDVDVDNNGWGLMESRVLWQQAGLQTQPDTRTKSLRFVDSLEVVELEAVYLITFPVRADVDFVEWYQGFFFFFPRENR